MMQSLAIRYKEYYQAEKPEALDIFCEIHREKNFKLADSKSPSVPCASFENSELHFIKVIDFERFVSQFKNGTKAGSGKRCDYILCDHEGDTLIFDELTETKNCYLTNHLRKGIQVEGKQEHALEQLKESVKRLSAVPDIKRAMTCTHKYLLFSHRDPDYTKDIVGTSAFKFSMTVSSKQLVKLDATVVEDYQTYIQPYPVPFSFR